MKRSARKSIWGGLLIAALSACSGDPAAGGNSDAAPQTNMSVPADATPLANGANETTVNVADIVSTAIVPLPAEPLDLPASNGVAPVEAFPPEVTAFMVDRDGCDHFRGEEAYDEARRAYLEDNIQELCSGTDARLAILRERFKDNPEVIDALRNYEDKIEVPALEY